MYRDGDCPGGVPWSWYGSLEHLQHQDEPGYHEKVVAAHAFCNHVREILTPDAFSSYLQSDAFGGKAPSNQRGKCATLTELNTDHPTPRRLLSLASSANEAE
jgi:hypothetical protein